VLTLRRVRYQFIVTGPDIEPMTFKTRHEAREWCREHFRGSPARRARRRHQEAAATKG
jgi:hypothetical protein